MHLPFTPPYTWEPMLAFFSKRAIPALEHIDAQGRYTRNTREGIVSVAPHVNGEGLDVQCAPDQVTRLRRMFDLDADPQRLAAHFATTARIGPLVKANPGLRIPGAFDPFELAVRAILGQQVSVDAARVLGGHLVDRYGEHAPTHEPRLTRLFPTPEALAAHEAVELGMPKARARAIANLARAAVADPNLFSAADSIDRLRAISGIGEWTAQYIALRGLRDLDAFPSADIGLMRAMADTHGTRPTAKELAKLSEAWHPYRGYAAQHLWNADAAQL